MPKKTTADALKILAHIAGNDPKRQQMFEEEVAARSPRRSICFASTLVSPKPSLPAAWARPSP